MKSFVLVSLLPSAAAYVADYTIGNHLHSSAWTFNHNERVLDLRSHCEAGNHADHVASCLALDGHKWNETDCHTNTLHPCPPLIIFDGNQDGTIEVNNLDFNFATSDFRIQSRNNVSEFVFVCQIRSNYLFCHAKRLRIATSAACTHLSTAPPVTTVSLCSRAAVVSARRPFPSSVTVFASAYVLNQMFKLFSKSTSNSW